MALQDNPTPTELSRLLVFALAASAGVHAALVPAHAAETPLFGAMFALSALALAGVAVWVDHTPGPVALVAAVLLLSSLLAAYAATRLVALPPLAHTEPVDPLGAATKLVEAAGLVLALRLFHAPAGHATVLPAQREGAGP